MGWPSVMWPVLLAQATDTPAGIVEVLLNYGPFGIILLLLLAGYLFPKPMIDHLQRENERLRKDNEHVRDENTQLRTSIEERIVPAMVRVYDLLERLTAKGL